MSTTVRRLVPLLLLIGAGWTGVFLLQSFAIGRVAEELSANAKPGDIVMLSSETCEYCKHARAWLTEHKVPFGECFIERDAACRARFDALQSPGTPMLVVRGQRQVGFSAERVAQALRQG
jgi:glutaredoxin